MNMFLNLVCFMLALLLGSMFTYFCIHLSHYYDLLDYPTERKNHAQPMPFLGGVGIFLAFWSVVFMGIAAAYLFDHSILNWREMALISEGILYLVPYVIQGYRLFFVKYFRRARLQFSFTTISIRNLSKGMSMPSVNVIT